MPNTNNILLDLKNLSIGFETDDGFVQATRDVSFTIKKGETLGIVGESGSGKSVSALAIMQLLPRNLARITSGSIYFYQEKENDTATDILSCTTNQMQRIRGNKIGMIFQEPMTSLNPVKRCGIQVAEGIIWHKKISDKEAKDKVISLFKEVQLPDPESVYNKYPHQLSGGQRQRVMIAMAVSCDPLLLIADEPTTALDVTVQKGILELIADLQKKHGMSVLFISHDLGVIQKVATDVIVMRKGVIVESGMSADILSNPEHPYSKGLVACRPRLDVRLSKLPVVSDFENADGNPPTITESTEERQKRHKKIYDQKPLWEIKTLKVGFPTQKNFFGKTKSWFYAVDDVSFKVFPGETLGLVGESGCGKTTLGRTVLQLMDLMSGEILYKGQNIAGMSKEEMRKLRPRIQIIFQDPYSSLTPGMQVGNAIMEPLKVHGLFGDFKKQRERVEYLLEKVGLEAHHFYRYPHEFSGGQRQRICIARALALQPEFIICDESVSALDVSVQAQVLNLLNQLKKEFNLTYVFISHDLSVVKYMSDRILVMKEGKIVESGEADEMYKNPSDLYTKKLLNSVM